VFSLADTKAGGYTWPEWLASYAGITLAGNPRFLRRMDACRRHMLELAELARREEEEAHHE
jgi:hypothetical protein